MITELRELRAAHGTPGATLPVHEVFPPALVDDARAFVRAGWLFMHASDAANLRDGVARVFSDGERLLLFDGSLSIRFRKDLALTEIDALLKEFGLEIVRRVPVAPNVFRVRRAGDPLQLSEDSMRDIERHDQVMFSEPSFIESIPHR